MSFSLLLYESKLGPALTPKKLKLVIVKDVHINNSQKAPEYKNHYRNTNKNAGNSLEGAMDTPDSSGAVSSDVEQRSLTR